MTIINLNGNDIAAEKWDEMEALRERNELQKKGKKIYNEMRKLRWNEKTDFH